MSELKNCPWGHPPKFDPKDGPRGSVTCSNPDCPVIGHLDPKEWNNRRADDAGRLKAAKDLAEAADRIISKHPDEWGDSPLAVALQAYYDSAPASPSAEPSWPHRTDDMGEWDSEGNWKPAPAKEDEKR